MKLIKKGSLFYRYAVEKLQSLFVVDVVIIFYLLNKWLDNDCGSVFLRIN